MKLLETSEPNDFHVHLRQGALLTQVAPYTAEQCARAMVMPNTDPTISDFNDLLKTGNVLDVSAWRQIQRLGDLRNLCDHNKHRDPTKEEVEELISGVERLTKSLF